MCGIVGYIGNRSCSDVLIDGLSKLEYRGYDSAGIAAFQDGKIKIVKAKGRLTELENRLKADAVEGVCGIGHTRWATHGEPSDVNSHPHASKKVCVVHNGIIENYVELKDFLTQKGYNFVSQTDTETAAHLLDYLYNGDPFEALREAIKLIKGSYALGVLFEDHPNVIFSIRKDSPLIIGIGENENFIASDIPAILRYTKNYYLLEENEIAEIRKDSIRIFNTNGDLLTKNVQTVSWTLEASEKGGYDHFMLKEINEQPKAVKNTVSPRIKNGLPDFSAENISDELFSGVKSITVVACGTAMHAGMVGKWVIEKFSRIPVNVDLASEFRYRDPIISKDDLVVVISQSGETADTLAALRLAKERGAKTLGVVNVVGSSIAREADHVIYTLAGPEIAVASTKAYSVQLSVMYLLAIKLGLISGGISADKAKELCKALLSVPENIEKVLKNTVKVKAFAEKICKSEDVFYIGRGLDYAVSMEGSLKLKEISYIHSEAYAAGELKHGPIALVEKDTPVIALATSDMLLDKTVSNIKEVKARGADVYVFAKETTEISEDVSENVFGLPVLDDILMPLLTVVPLQLLAYYCAIFRGCDVDKPRNLAKSVTVE